MNALAALAGLCKPLGPLGVALLMLPAPVLVGESGTPLWDMWTGTHEAERGASLGVEAVPPPPAPPASGPGDGPGILSTEGLANGGFETGTTSSWTTGGSASIVSGGQQRSGTYALRLGDTTNQVTTALSDSFTDCNFNSAPVWTPSTSYATQACQYIAGIDYSPTESAITTVVAPDYSELQRWGSRIFFESEDPAKVTRARIYPGVSTTDPRQSAGGDGYFLEIDKKASPDMVRFVRQSGGVSLADLIGPLSFPVATGGWVHVSIVRTAAGAWSVWIDNQPVGPAVVDTAFTSTLTKVGFSDLVNDASFEVYHDDVTLFIGAPGTSQFYEGFEDGNAVIAPSWAPQTGAWHSRGQAEASGSASLPAAGAEASGSPSKVRTSIATPLARRSSAIAEDSASGKAVLFGGTDDTGEAMGDTWVYDLRENFWDRKYPSSSPPARKDAAMVLTGPGSMTMFGGQDSIGSKFADTWSYDIATNVWTHLSPTCPGSCPAARSDHALAWFPPTSKAILVAGLDSAGPLSDTWEFDPSGPTWTNLCDPCAFSARSGHGLSTDGNGIELVMFGGTTGGGETWIWNGAWSQLFPSLSPPGPRSDVVIAVDTSLPGVVLFGGVSAGIPWGDTWRLDRGLGTWVDMAPASGPSARHSAVMTNGFGGRLLLFGGHTPTALGDTWWLDTPSNSWIQVPQFQPDFTDELVWSSRIFFEGEDTGKTCSGRWYLALSHSTLDPIPPAIGYYVEYEMCGANDALTLFRQDGTGASSVTGGSTDFAPATWYTIRVLRTAEGRWSLFRDFSPIGSSALDTTYPAFGVQLTHMGFRDTVDDALYQVWHDEIAIGTPSYAYQDVAIPSSALYIRPVVWFESDNQAGTLNDPGSDHYLLQVRSLTNNPIVTLRFSATTFTGWNYEEYDLSLSYAGTTVRLLLLSFDDREPGTSTTVRFDDVSLSFARYPSKPSIVQPFDSRKGGASGLSPDFEFSTTDGDADELVYHIQLDDDAAFQSTFIDRPSSGPQEMASDGSGESDSMSFWTTDGDAEPFPIVSGVPRTGFYAFQIGDGSRAAAGWDFMTQVVPVPIDASTVAFTAWYATFGTPDVDDLARILIRERTCTSDLATALSINLGTLLSSYTQVTVDLTPYRGQEVCLYLAQFSDTSVDTRLRVDDISVIAAMSTTAGFTNTISGGDTSPFNSNQNIRFQSGTSFAEGSVWWWRVRAFDVADQVWSGWTSPRSFTASPVAVERWSQTSEAQFDTGTIGSAISTSEGGGAIELVSGKGGTGLGEPAVTGGALSSGYTQFDCGNTITVSGKLTRWSFISRTSATGGTIKLKVFRDDGSNYVFIGETAAESVPGGGGTWTFTASLDVQAGDMVGQWHTGAEVSYASDGATCRKYQNADVVTTQPYGSWNNGGGAPILEVTVIPTTVGTAGPGTQGQSGSFATGDTILSTCNSISMAGKLTQWSVKVATGPLTVKLKVYRDDGTNYNLVGQTGFENTGSAAGVYTFYSEINVAIGDLLALYHTAGTFGATGAGLCRMLKSGDDQGSLKLTWTGPAADTHLLKVVVTTEGSARSTGIRYADGPAGRTSWGRLEWTETETGGKVSMYVQKNSAADCSGTWTSAAGPFTTSPASIASLGTEACIRLFLSMVHQSGGGKLFDWDVVWAAAPINEALRVFHAGSQLADGGRLYANLTNQEFKVKVTDSSGGADINYIDLRLDGSPNYVARWIESSDTFTEIAGGQYFDILSGPSDSVLTGDTWDISFRMQIYWSWPLTDRVVDPGVTSVDDGGSAVTDTFTGSSYFVEDDLVFRETRLIGHWRLDEAVGTTAGDSSGLGHTGTLSCCPPTWIPGRTGRGALDFDGVDDKVTVGDTDALDATAAVTVMAWVRVDVWGDYDRFVDKALHPTEPGNNGGYSLLLDTAATGRAIFEVYVGGVEPYRNCLPAAGSLVAGAWTHLAGTYDGTTVRLYKNGVQICSATYGTPLPAFPTARPLVLGNAGAPTATNWLDGALDEVRVYARPLGGAEIAEHASSEVNDAREGLVAEYRFDEDTVGPTAKESSGLGADGVIGGAPLGVAGKYGRALQFDQNNKVEISGLKVDTVPGSGAKSTVEFWMYWDGSAGLGGEGVMPFGWGGAEWYDIWLKSGVNCFGFNTGSNDIYGARIPADLANSWHHVAAVFHNGPLFDNGDPDQPNVALYLDGVSLELFQCAAITSGSKVMTSSARIGRAGNYDQSVYSFSGRLDEFRIWNRELTQREVAARAGLPEPDYDAGLAAEFRFSEGSGTSTQDHSGKGNTATLCQGGAGCPFAGPAWRSGRAGRGLEFDGVDDYVEVAHSASLMRKSVSVEAWIFPRSYSAQFSRIVEKGGANVGGGYGLEFNPTFSPGSVNFVIWDGLLPQYIYSSTVIPLDAWTHVAGTFDGYDQRLYVNGVLEAASTASMSANTERLTIGRSSWPGSGACPGPSPDCYFDGSIDEVRVYDRALSADEVEEHAWLAAQDRETDLVGNWRFLEPSGTVALDSSSSGNTANLVNGVTRGAGVHSGGARFDGVDDHVNAGKRASLDSGTFTAAFWVKGDAAPGGGAVSAVVKKHSSDVADAETFSFIWHHPDPLVQQACVMNTVPSISWVKAKLTTPLAPNVWHHVACSYDGTDLKAYLNGALESSVASGPPSVGTSSFIIGGGGTNGNSPAQFFAGSVDEVRVYSTALPATEIAAIHGATARSVLPSGLRVSGSAHLSGDTWTRPGNPLTWSGLSAYYEGSLVQPADAEVDLRIRDDAGNSWTQASGLDLDLGTSADSAHDASDIHEVGIVRIPGGNGFVDRRAFELKVDGLAPAGAPGAPVADGSNPSPWSDLSQFSLDWGNPADDTEIAGVWWKANAPPTGPTDGTFAAGRPATALTGLASGTHTLYLWLEDSHANRDHTKSSTVTLRVDQEPVVFVRWQVFEDGQWRDLTHWQNSNRTATLRAEVTADLSGIDVDMADVEYRYTSDGVLDSEPFSFAHAPTQFLDDTESGPNGFGPTEHCDTGAFNSPFAIATPGAGYTQSGATSWWVDNAAGSSTEVLESPEVTMPWGALSAKLRFFHRMNSGAGDYGWLEYSVDGGAWRKPGPGEFESGGYNADPPAGTYCGTLVPGTTPGNDVWKGSIQTAGAMSEVVMLLPADAIGSSVRWRYIFRTDFSGAPGGLDGWWIDAFESWGNYAPSVHTCAALVACDAPSGATGTLWVKLPSVPFTADSSTLNRVQLRLRKISAESNDSASEAVRIDTSPPAQTVNNGAYSYAADPGPTVDVDHADGTSGLDGLAARFIRSWPDSAPPWTNTIANGAGGSPSARMDHVAVLDEASDRMIMFGGDDGAVKGDLWLLQGASSAAPVWKQVSPTGAAPSARTRSGAILDQATDRMVLFGGVDSGGNAKNEVYLLRYASGTTGTPSWSIMATAGGPPSARYAMNVHYDSANNRMILFGGYSAPTGWLDDTWVLTFANGLGGSPTWTQLAPAGGPPPRRCCYASGYDPVSNRLLVFGGQTTASGKLSDYWVLRDANGIGAPQWVSISPSGSAPSARVNMASAYDVDTDRLIIFGGDDGSKRNAVWMIENASGAAGDVRWKNTVAEGAGGAPPARSNSFAVYAPKLDRLVVFGGRDSTPAMRNDVWVLQNAHAMGPSTGWEAIFDKLNGAASQTANFDLWVIAPVGASRVELRATDLAGNTFRRTRVYYEVAGEPVTLVLRLGANLVGWSATLTSAYGNLTLAQFGRAIRNSTGQVPAEVAVYEPGAGWVSVTSPDGIFYAGAAGDPAIQDGQGILVRMTGSATSFPVTFGGTGRPITAPVTVPMDSGTFAITIPEKTGGGTYTGTSLLDAISADAGGSCHTAEIRCAYSVLKLNSASQQWMQVTWDCSFFCGYSWSDEDFTVGPGDAVMVFVSGAPKFAFSP